MVAATYFLTKINTNADSYKHVFSVQLQSLQDLENKNSYFQGQKDALEGNVKIRKNSEGNYAWIESPDNNIELQKEVKVP
jgi:hypothetical protein